MGLEDVVGDVVARAEKEADKLRSEGKNEAEGIIAKANHRSIELEKDANDDLDKQIDKIRARAIASQNLEGKKSLLGMEKAAIDLVYTTASEKLPSLAAKDKEKIIKSCVEKAADSLDAKFIYCRKEDEKLVKKLASGLKVVPTLDSLGGVIIEDAYHERMENYTFESIMENTREATLPDVHNLLFGGK